jgi:hypothetical protein
MLLFTDIFLIRIQVQLSLIFSPPSPTFDHLRLTIFPRRVHDISAFDPIEVLLSFTGRVLAASTP